MLRAIGVLAISCFLAGCTDTSSSLTSTAVPTMLTVDPLKFRGALRCGAPELQSYVVALTDVSDQPTLVAVSLPATCPNLTSFGAPTIMFGHLYTAVIDGYDRADLTPAGPSSRVMHDPEGNTVKPRWATTCGPAPASDNASASAVDASDTDASTPTTTAQNPLVTPTQALLSTEVFLQGCHPLAEVPLADASTPDGLDCGRLACDGSADDGASAEADAAAEAGDDAADGGSDDAPDATPNGG